MDEQSEQSLSGLRRIQGVTAAYIVDPTSEPPSGGDGIPDAQRALLSALVAQLAHVVDDLDAGSLSEVIVEADRGAIVAGSLPGGRAAVALAGPGTNLGMIRVEMRRLRRSS